MIEETSFKQVASSPREYVKDKTLEEFKSAGVKVTPVAIRFDGSEPMLIKLSDGTIVGYSIAIELCREKLLDGFMLSFSKLGEEYIKGIGDGKPDNNLQNLPRF